MTQLAAAVDADDKLWTIDTMPDAPYLQVENELVEVSARFPEHVYKPTMETIPDKIRVVRAQAGTTAASHNNGTTLTPVYEVSTATGSGGVTVDNQSDPPAEVTTLIAPGADLSTPGQADFSTAEGLQRIRLLGPYDLDHADAGLDEPWPAHFRFGEALVANTVVIDWYVAATEDWISTDADIDLTLGVVPTADEDLDNSQGGLTLRVRASGAPIGYFALPWSTFVIAPNHQIGAIQGPSLRIPLIVPMAGRFFATIDYAGNGVAVTTSGKLRAYALIAEPAS